MHGRRHVFLNDDANVHCTRVGGAFYGTWSVALAQLSLALKCSIPRWGRQCEGRVVNNILGWLFFLFYDLLNATVTLLFLLICSSFDGVCRTIPNDLLPANVCLNLGECVWVVMVRNGDQQLSLVWTLWINFATLFRPVTAKVACQRDTVLNGKVEE